jgi:hypothetical protein
LQVAGYLGHVGGAALGRRPGGQFSRQPVRAEPRVLRRRGSRLRDAEFGAVVRGGEFRFGFAVVDGRDDVALKVVQLQDRLTASAALASDLLQSSLLRARSPLYIQ